MCWTNLNVLNSPIRTNFDALDPVSTTAVRPTLKEDMSIVDDHVLVPRLHNGAPTIDNESSSGVYA